MTKPRICKLFFDVNMALGHDGLAELAKKAGVKLDLLDTGDLLMFLNRKGTRLKVLGAQGKVVGYLRMPDNRPIMREALQFIPQTFGSEGFDYTHACRIALSHKGIELN